MGAATLIVGLGLMALAIAASVAYWPAADVAAQDAQPISTSAAELPQPAVQALPVQTSSVPAPEVVQNLLPAPARVEAGGLTMELRRLVLGVTEVTGTPEPAVLATVCYALPAAGDWRIGTHSTFLEAGGIQLPLRTQGLQDYATARNVAGESRCQELGFFTGEHKVAFASWRLMIGDVRIETNERPDCAKAQRALDEAKTGIAVTCDATGSYSLDLSQRSTAMTETELANTLRDAFDTVNKGPWAFAGSLP